MASLSLADQIAVKHVSENRFQSKIFPRNMGNSPTIAYGGCTASIAVHAAYETITKPNFHIFSVLGAFHGPARTDRCIDCTVTRTRDTKTFATRRVVASQIQDDGSERTCMDVFIDFQVEEPALFTFSAAPMKEHLESGPEDPQTTISTSELADALVQSKKASGADAAAYKKSFRMADTFFENRHCTAGVAGQNLNGLAKHVVTTQDHLPIAEKTSAEWIRTRQSLRTEAEHMAAMTFIMDGALSFLVLNHDHKNFEDAGACSTLDFALRIMKPGADMSQWHLKERKMVAASGGRTLATGKLWDEKGNLVAVESQTCIVRPPVRKDEEKPKSVKAKI